MKCLILCGGRGIIDPITGSRIPKALLKIGNRPLIWHVMKLFSLYGHTDFVLALGQGGDKIKDYFINGFELLHDVEVNLKNNDIVALNKIPEENWSIKLVDTGISANTGSRIARCERYLKHEPFFITYSDVLSDVNLTNLEQYHQQNDTLVTVTGVHPPSRFGVFYTKEATIKKHAHVVINNSNDDSFMAHKATNNANKGDKQLSYNAQAKLEMHESRINGGFMIANEGIFKILSPISECNLETEIFDTLITHQQISLWKHNGFWQNVDTERDIQYLQNLYENNKRPWLGIN